MHEAMLPLDTTKTRWRPLGALVVFALIAVGVSTHSTASRSVELTFADHTPRGLGVVPASCESSPPYPHSTGECTCPTGLANTGDAGGYVIGSGQLARQANRNSIFFCLDNRHSSGYFIPTRTLGEMQLFEHRAPTLRGVSIYTYTVPTYFGPYATWNTIDTRYGAACRVFSNSNFGFAGAGCWAGATATRTIRAGKFAFKATLSGNAHGGAEGNVYSCIGFGKPDITTPYSYFHYADTRPNVIGICDTGWVYNFAAGAQVTSPLTNGTTVEILIDYPNTAYTIKKNGVTVSTGTLNYTGPLAPIISDYDTSSNFIVDFGQSGYVPPAGYDTVSIDNIP